MKWFQTLKKQQWFNMAAAFCIAILFYFLVKNIGVLGTVISGVAKVVTPLFVGVVIAYLINPIACFFESKIKAKKETTSWKAGVALAVILVALCILLFIAILVPSIVSSISNLSSGLDQSLANLQESMSGIAGGAISKAIGNIDADQLTSTISSYLEQADLASASASVGSALGNFFIGFILAIYYLLDKKRLVGSIQKFLAAVLPTTAYKELSQFCYEANSILINYIAYSLLEALIVGVANAIFMVIFGMPYIVVISIVVGVTNLAPTFGPIVGAVVGGAILLLYNPIMAIEFLIFTAILQTIDGYVLKPKMFGGSLGVSPLLILVFIIVLGKIFGVIGILLAIPASAIVSYIIRRLIDARSLIKERADIEKKKLEEQAVFEEE